MFPGYLDFKNLLENEKIEMDNKNFNDSIKQINFYLMMNENDFTEELKQKLKSADFIIIDLNEQSTIKYFIFCFDQQLMIVDEFKNAIIQNLFYIGLKEDKFFFLSNSHSILRDLFIKIIFPCAHLTNLT